MLNSNDGEASMREGEPLRPKINVRRARGVRKGHVRYSDRVERRREMAKTLCASIETLKVAASSGFAERFTAELREGEPAPDHALALELVARSVESALAVLEGAESEYVGLGSRRVAERREGERIARRELNPRMVLLRREIESECGREAGADIHGLKGKTLREPRRVLRQARGLVATLKTERSRRPIARSEREAWLRQVEPACDRLAASIEELEGLERKEEYARGVRDLAFERFDAAYSEASAYAHTVYRLGGLGERVIHMLRPDVEHRRLRREAGQEQRARAEGRRRSAVAPFRSAVRVASRWLKHFRRPRRVA